MAEMHAPDPQTAWATRPQWAQDPGISEARIWRCARRYDQTLMGAIRMAGVEQAARELWVRAPGLQRCAAELTRWITPIFPARQEPSLLVQVLRTAVPAALPSARAGDREGATLVFASELVAAADVLATQQVVQVHDKPDRPAKRWDPASEPISRWIDRHRIEFVRVRERPRTAHEIRAMRAAVVPRLIDRRTAGALLLSRLTGAPRSPVQDEEEVV